MSSFVIFVEESGLIAFVNVTFVTVDIIDLFNVPSKRAENRGDGAKPARAFGMRDQTYTGCTACSTAHVWRRLDGRMAWY